ncbi:3-dehydroquinate synthase [Chloroflexi bacterium TSY]|nr:3-dehydroquinate synthase [Chloroflexi bacterium TSY]
MNYYPLDKNIILTGFMGTGKTTIGQSLAKRLNREFIDMDTQIEAHYGKPISQVFADEGEPHFRVTEARLCQQLSEQSGLVISTGGGALVNSGNRKALATSGVIICLTATVDEILRRVDEMGIRPLLDNSPEERRQRIRNLLHERRHAYAAIVHQVDTTGRTPEHVVDGLFQTLAAEQEVSGMTLIPVKNPLGSYDICLGEGLLEHAGTLLRNRGVRVGPAAVVTNPIIGAHFADTVGQSLRAAGFEPTICTVPDGEEHKTLETMASIYDQLMGASLDRSSPLIALGGGVVGDMMGFAAASFLRGVPFVQLPTSLLSMVDASVGGKTGVDLPQGKNLVGAFKQPEVVIIDTKVLETLPAVEFRCGLAETIKHGIIDAPDLFEQIEEHGPTSLTHMVADAVRVKVRVVEEDPYEHGRRALLNLGHTFGHPIEHVSGYQVRHGEAVAAGIVASAHLAASIECCSPKLVTRIHNVLDRVGLPTHFSGYDLDETMAIMRHDKKRKGKTLRFIIPQEIGDVTIIDDPGTDLVRSALAKVLY